MSNVRKHFAETKLRVTTRENSSEDRKNAFQYVCINEVCTFLTIGISLLVKVTTN